VASDDACLLTDLSATPSAKPTIAGKWEVASGPLLLSVDKRKVTGSYPFAGVAE